MKRQLYTWLATATLCLGTRGETDKPALSGPLLHELGALEHPITTQSSDAQRYFNQGLTLCYAFNHQEAIRSFQSAATLDPDCPMAYWGMALAHGPHVNKPMSEQDNLAAWEALEKAQARKGKGHARERAYIDALSRRYTAQHQQDRAGLDQAYANAMRELSRAYPDDLDAQVLFAEALMDTMPWDYWAKDRSPKPETEEALAALRFVLARHPAHPGANHLFVHAVEAGPNPELGLPSADRLLKYAPAAGHLVHMPSHIYMRVGQYQDAITANELAVAADRSYLRQSRAQGFYPGVYYPHNMHFLWWALLFEGRSQDALKVAEEAAQYAVDNYCSPSKAIEAPRFRHLPWLTMLRFGRWDDVLRVPQPAVTNDFILDRAVWHFSRGLAFAAQARADLAEQEQAALRGIATSEALQKLDSAQLPASTLVSVADAWLLGKVQQAKGHRAAAIENLEKAVALEDAMPYMEPAYWPLPARPALGAALLEAGEAAKAETVFREDLRRWWRNGWGLLGLEHALRAQGKKEAADLVHRQFDAAWKRADTKLQLAWF